MEVAVICENQWTEVLGWYFDHSYQVVFGHDYDLANDIL